MILGNLHGHAVYVKLTQKMFAEMVCTNFHNVMYVHV